MKGHTTNKSVRLQSRVVEVEEQLGWARKESPEEARRVIAGLREEVEEVREEKRRLREELDRQQEEGDFSSGELRRLGVTASSLSSGSGEGARELGEPERRRLVSQGG